MLRKPRQESVTLETLELLQETVNYLKRLPMVPVTRDLIRKLDGHLEDPGVAAARREAESAELQTSKRVAKWFSPAGQKLLEALVEGDELSLKLPANVVPIGYEDRRFEQLRDGITLELEPSPTP